MTKNAARIISSTLTGGTSLTLGYAHCHPLLLTPEASPLPTLDSTRRVARAAYDIATSHPHGRPGAVARAERRRNRTDLAESDWT
jgi:hypothetical protein